MGIFASKQANFQHTPFVPEIMNLIFSYVPILDQVRLQRVSKYWQHCSSNSHEMLHTAKQKFISALVIERGKKFDFLATSISLCLLQNWTFEVKFSQKCEPDGPEGLLYSRQSKLQGLVKYVNHATCLLHVLEKSDKFYPMETEFRNKLYRNETSGDGRMLLQRIDDHVWELRIEGEPYVFN